MNRTIPSQNATGTGTPSSNGTSGNSPVVKTRLMASSMRDMGLAWQLVAQPRSEKRVDDAPAAARGGVLGPVGLREQAVARRMGRAALAEPEARFRVAAGQRDG